MPHGTDEHTGARIKRARKARGLSQRELADLSPVSYSTITKVEQGIMPASPAVIAALARALSAPVTELTGQPYLDELRQDQLDGLIQPIREALDVYDLGADPEVTPRSLTNLRAHAEELCALVRDTNLKRAASAISGLIWEATTGAHQANTTEAWQVLASTYRTAYDIATKLGYSDLATVALDRMEWAAGRASDAVLGGLRQYMRSLEHLRAGQFRTGQRLVSVALRTLEQAPPSRDLEVARGQLHLGMAVLYARDQQGGQADEHLAEAERIAGNTGPAERVYWLSFGPTNVGVHRVSVLAERDEYGAAVEAAKGVAIPEDWPRSRRAHHHAEVARALMWSGHPEASFRELLRARKAGPQQTRYHPTVRETYAGLEAAQRRAEDSFVSFGSWLGA